MRPHVQYTCYDVCFTVLLTFYGHFPDFREAMQSSGADPEAVGGDKGMRLSRQPGPGAEPLDS